MKRITAAFLLVALCISVSACGFVTSVDEMYQLPVRAQEDHNLQSLIEQAMTGLEYSAPLTGDNQQTVQTADLTGDGLEEFLVFAKNAQERILKVMIFGRKTEEEDYRSLQTIEMSGTSFDKVSYIQMDSLTGQELVIGYRLSDELIRNISVYCYNGTELERRITTEYTRYVTVDANEDGATEIMMLRPGEKDTDRGTACLYYWDKGEILHYNEVELSESADNLKRVIVGKLSGGQTAVFAASRVGEAELITDILAVREDALANVSFSNDSGTSMRTLRNYDIYATDIDGDSETEIPDALTMVPVGEQSDTDVGGQLIRWYAMDERGNEVTKKYTLYYYSAGWYLEIDEALVSALTVAQATNKHQIYAWDKEKENPILLATVQTVSLQKVPDGADILCKTDTVCYIAEVAAAAKQYGISAESLKEAFHLISSEWKTGEV